MGTRDIASPSTLGQGYEQGSEPLGERVVIELLFVNVSSPRGLVVVVPSELTSGESL